MKIIGCSLLLGFIGWALIVLKFSIFFAADTTQQAQFTTSTYNLKNHFLTLFWFEIFAVVAVLPHLGLFQIKTFNALRANFLRLGYFSILTISMVTFYLVIFFVAFSGSAISFDPDLIVDDQVDFVKTLKQLLGFLVFSYLIATGILFSVLGVVFLKKILIRRDF